MDGHCCKMSNDGVLLVRGWAHCACSGTSLVCIMVEASMMLHMLTRLLFRPCKKREGEGERGGRGEDVYIITTSIYLQLFYSFQSTKLAESREQITGEKLVSGG